MVRNVIAGLTLFAGLLAPEPLAAQTYWRVPGALALGLFGAGVGYATDVVAWNASDCGLCGPTLTKTTVGLGAGAVLGFATGLHADLRLARGDTLTARTRVRLRFCTFLAPVAVGSAVAFAIINPREDYNAPPPRVADQTVTLLGIGGGMVLGSVLVRRYERALYPRSRVSVLPDRRGIQLAYSAAW